MIALWRVSNHRNLARSSAPRPQRFYAPLTLFRHRS
jgi:hypothetical protein